MRLVCVLTSEKVKKKKKKHKKERKEALKQDLKASERIKHCKPEPSKKSQRSVSRPTPQKQKKEG